MSDITERLRAMGSSGFMLMGHQQYANEAADEIERLRASEAAAWRERNIAYAKVKARESVVFIENLPLRAVRVSEWGPGEGEMTSVPDVTPRKLTELLDELARLRAALGDQP